MTDEDVWVVKHGRFIDDPEGLEEFLDNVKEMLVAMETRYSSAPL